MARWLIVSGAILILAGFAWPWILKLGLGHLPGDIRIEGKGFGFYFPITTGLLVSAVLTLIFWLFRK
ncbi:MAG: DUF2905 domain-containing protein [Burkholderiales bacterium]